MEFDYILKNGMIHDGTGYQPYETDIGIKEDRIAKIGLMDEDDIGEEIDVKGLIVAPGFINMLSWSVESLLTDGRAMSTITQGVTLEVMGEGHSWGPLNDDLKSKLKNIFSTVDTYDITWDTLGEYLQHLEELGVSTNVASFIGSATARSYFLGDDDCAPTDEEMKKMQGLVEQAMQEGAMGVSSALIYPPNSFCTTDELIALAQVASKYGGMYISHIRSEGQQLEEAVEEVITIAREADVAAEIYHLKAAGKSNWHKLDLVIERIRKTREEGLQITTDCYMYTAAGTGLDSCLPPMPLGREQFIKYIDEHRDELKKIMLEPSDEWENLYFEAGAENIYPMVFRKEELRKYAGKSVAELAEQLGKDPRDVIIDLLIEDESRIGTTYHIMTEDNIRKKIALEFMSFGSDGASVAPEGKVLEQGLHPRAYGNFTRLLAKYVRDEEIITLEDAINRLTMLPATNLKLKHRGMLKEGYFADIAIFDLKKLQDKATYEQPHQLSEGMVHVFVNGEPVLRDGIHTGAKPGRFVKGPGGQEPEEVDEKPYDAWLREGPKSDDWLKD